MAAVNFDYFKQLEQVGFTHEQAVVLIALTSEVSANMIDHETLVNFKKEIKHEVELSESRLETAFKKFGMRLLEEIQAVRTDLTKEIQAVRTDLTNKIQEVRVELKTEIQEVRAELKAEIQEVRVELKAEIQEVRADLTNIKVDCESLKREVKFIKGLVIFLAGALSTTSLLFGLLKVFP